MATELKEIHENIKLIKENLTKLSYEKRTPERLKSKLSEATILYNRYKDLLEILDLEIKSKKIFGENLLLIRYYCDKISELFTDISNFCNKSHIRVKESTIDTFGSTSSSISTSKKEYKMEFELKTALSLLPAMNDDVSSTKQLIDGVEYYSSILEKNECQINLINFVLKNRLSQSAKLKLSSSYATVKELLADMRTALLPKKSYVALQNRLQSLRQEQKSIDEFGRELSEIFMDLTISQADGKTENLKILQPLNEKQAIKRFADGLRNRRLSTIIAARNFDTLKDAIQAAVDEEVPAPSTSGDILTMSNRGRKSFRGYRGNRNFYTRTFHSHVRGRGSYNHSRPSAPAAPAPAHHGPPHRGRGNPGRGQSSYRGQYPNSYNRYNSRGQRGSFQYNVNVMTDNTEENGPSVQQNKFFRD